MRVALITVALASVAAIAALRGPESEATSDGDGASRRQSGHHALAVSAPATPQRPPPAAPSAASLPAGPEPGEVAEAFAAALDPFSPEHTEAWRAAAHAATMEPIELIGLDAQTVAELRTIDEEYVATVAAEPGMTSTEFEAHVEVIKRAVAAREARERALLDRADYERLQELRRVRGHTVHETFTRPLLEELRRKRR